MIKLYRYSKYLPVFIAVTSLVIFVVLIFKFTEFNKNIHEKDEKSKVQDVLISKKSQLEKALYSRIYYTRGIAAYVSFNPKITKNEFEELAKEIIKKDMVISTMSLSKDCIISAIYPVEGHEAAIGLNLLAHPARKLIVESTIKTRNTFIAGPVELVEGGIAFISYTPIFINPDTDSSKFWGVTDIVILKDKLFNEVGLKVNDGEYIYALKGDDGHGKDGVCFWGDSTIFAKDPVTVNVSLPTGDWYFACLPVKGWQNSEDKAEKLKYFLYLAALIISILIWLLTNAIIKIRNNERQLKALFGSMQDLIIEFNGEGRYMKIAPTNETLLVKPPKELLGKTLHEIFDKQAADYFLEAIRKCLATKQLVVIEYPLKINSELYWFSARISYISDNSVIYVAHDYTNRKKAEEELKESANKLMELNKTKDKFFSIIAHDLKAPFAGFLGLTKMMADDLPGFSQEELKSNSIIMKESAIGLYKLLENLLEWARMQRGQIEFNPEMINLSQMINFNISIVDELTNQKNIHILNKVKTSVLVRADIQMLNAIFRNIISNAIKFTNRGGLIEIGSSLRIIKINDKPVDFNEIYIRDNGIGISQKDIGKLFRLDQKVSSLGTEGEPSTGLGLLLCKDFVERHGGSIRVESTEGEGTTFYFTLPVK